MGSLEEEITEIQLEESQPQQEETNENKEQEVVFEDAINFEDYDEFNLSAVLTKRKEEVGPGNTIIINQPNENKEKYGLKNIDKTLNFEEDIEALQVAAEYHRKILEQKLLDSVVELNMKESDDENEESDNDDAEVEVPIPEIPSKPSADASKKPSSHSDWVGTGKLPNQEYERLRPNMALTYPFELDEFQKQAVMRLERREHVFVAAHTSAGKTVVAEYGIALALKNNSRTVYTSPIKALSNQKYRDFKDKFGVDNVGIVTGDVSVNPQAQCLIMTTEIFRSMLYKGHDTIRDIEFVIFDEVHYVNDAERGVVWEEVIIMLPETITLIFLSATTPNAVEFSEWIGRTKRRKVHLISTNKRPVPLQHFLYYDNEMYKLLEGETKSYIPTALSAAKQRIKDKSKPTPKTAENAKFANDRMMEKANIAAQKAGGNKAAQQKIMGKVMQNNGGRGGGGGRGGAGGGMGGRPSGSNTGGKAQWVGLINILQAGGRENQGGLNEINFGIATSKNILSKKAREEKNTMTKYEKLPYEVRKMMSKKEYEAIEVRGSEDDPVGEIGLLPVVIFSFSKKKCEEIADFFKGMDLLSNQEKSKVVSIIDQVIARLNPVDTDLPQIIRMKEMLCRGIGVHHGGLLPILKETVEILFSEGVLKVLLATETFAMGVNMPARCVVFNGFRKHDGKSFRDLLSGEYIQMAGRAGRRGLDATGTVIITSWNDLPFESDLKKLLTGRPTLLSSQFRLRYNMILNLVRVNNLSVQQMMKSSFTEFASQKLLLNHDISNKRKQYEDLLNYLHDKLHHYVHGKPFQEVVLPVIEGEAEETPAVVSLASASQNLELDQEERHLIFKEIKEYFHLFQQIQDYMNIQLQYLLIKNKTLDNVLTEGRVIVYASADGLGYPVPGIVLMNATNTKAQLTAASAPKISKLGDISSSRAALLGLNSPTKPETNGNKTTFDEMYVYVLSISDLGDMPQWCQDSLSSTALNGPQDQCYSSELPSQRTCYTLSTGLPYVVQRVAVKDIGLVSNQTIRTKSAFDEVNNVTNVNLDLTSMINQLVLLISKQLPWNNLYNMMKEQKVNDIDFAERFELIGTLAKKCADLLPMLESYLLPFKTTQLPYPLLLSVLYPQLIQIHKISNKLSIIAHLISDESMSLFPDFQQRINILKHLGYMDKMDRIITKKGRVACELNTCDELLGTEILFHNILEPLNPPEAVAMLSALIFQEKNDVQEQLTSRMEFAREQILEIHDQLTKLQEIEHIEIDPDAKPILNFGLCAVVYQWARGISFKDIIKMTEFQEGSIVRTIVRLDELCRDVQNAAKIMGNEILYLKMEAASECIKRDIVFAASLYIAP